MVQGTEQRGDLMTIFRASDAALWSGGRHYGPDIQLCRLWKNDSREIAPGDAFVALKGEKADGHNFVQMAIERGARLLLVDADRMDELSLCGPECSGITVIAVRETAKALTQIAGEYLRRLAPKTVGITGSVGKTTTRELTVSLLKAKKRVHSAIRSYNTVIGCSLTILAMPEDTEVLVLEFGTNHFGEIREMAALFPPQLAVITEVAPAHLEGFGDVDGVLSAKMEICESEKLEMLIYNADNENLRNALSYKFDNIKKLGVGRWKGADMRIIESVPTLKGDGAHLLAVYENCGRELKFSLNLFGSQHSYNAGYAYLIGDHFGVGIIDAEEKLSEFMPILGRGICKKLPQNKWVIDEAYNANPSSMGAAVRNTLDVARGSGLSAFAVLGGMRELGGSSAFWHNDILKSVSHFSKAALLGDEWFAPEVVLPPCAQRYRTFEEISSQLDIFSAPDSVLLIKGSNSYGLKRLVALLTEGGYVY